MNFEKINAWREKGAAAAVTAGNDDFDPILRKPLMPGLYNAPTELLDSFNHPFR